MEPRAVRSWALEAPAAQQVAGLSNKQLMLFAQRSGLRLQSLQDLLLAIRSDSAVLDRLTTALPPNQRDQVTTIISSALEDNSNQLDSAADRLGELVSLELSRNDNVVASILGNLKGNPHHLQLLCPLVCRGWWSGVRYLDAGRATQCSVCAAQQTWALGDIKDCTRALEGKHDVALLDLWLVRSCVELYMIVEDDSSLSKFKGKLTPKARNLFWRCTWLSHCPDATIKDIYLRLLTSARLTCDSSDQAQTASDTAWLLVEKYVLRFPCVALGITKHWDRVEIRNAADELHNRHERTDAEQQQAQYDDALWLKEKVCKPHMLNPSVLQKVLFDASGGAKAYHERYKDDNQYPEWYLLASSAAQQALAKQLTIHMRKKSKLDSSPRSQKAGLSISKSSSFMGVMTDMPKPNHKGRQKAATALSSKKKMGSSVNCLQDDDFDDGSWDYGDYGDY